MHIVHYMRLLFLILGVLNWTLGVAAEICPTKRGIVIDILDTEKFQTSVDDLTFKIWLQNQPMAQSGSSSESNVVDETPDKPLGTATLVSPEGFLLTSKHPFTMGGGWVRENLEKQSGSLLVEKYDIRLGYRYSYSARLVAVALGDTDLAILKITKGKDWQPSGPLRLELRDPLYYQARMMGYKLNEHRPISSGIGSVHDIKGDNIRIDLNVYRGYSGSAVFNQFGEGYGVLSGRYRLPEDYSGWEELDLAENE